jgi:hypothetical protein
MYLIAKSAALAVIALLACCCLWVAQIALAEESPVNANQVDLYRVPLMCPAARGLGCGMRAKPILIELERTSAVAEAWLDHSGETLAVIWANNTPASERTTLLANIGKEHSVQLAHLTGQTRDASLTSFRSRQEWHRGADVDRLSEQEAEVIADRLIHRTINKAPSAKAKMDALRPALTDTIRKQLIDAMPSTEECRERLMTAARPNLNENELSAFVSAFELGYRPVGDEK